MKSCGLQTLGVAVAAKSYLPGAASLVNQSYMDDTTCCVCLSSCDIREYVRDSRIRHEYEEHFSWAWLGGSVVALFIQPLKCFYLYLAFLLWFVLALFAGLC